MEVKERKGERESECCREKSGKKEFDLTFRKNASAQQGLALWHTGQFDVYRGPSEDTRMKITHNVRARA